METVQKKGEKARPPALNTVEMLRVASAGLGMFIGMIYFFLDNNRKIYIFKMCHFSVTQTHFTCWNVTSKLALNLTGFICNQKMSWYLNRIE